MKKITHYVVAVGRATRSEEVQEFLKREINSFLEKGYVPYGRLVAVILGEFRSVIKLYQPMVMYEPEEDMTKDG